MKCNYTYHRPLQGSKNWSGDCKQSWTFISEKGCESPALSSGRVSGQKEGAQEKEEFETSNSGAVEERLN